MEPLWSDERIAEATSGKVPEIELLWHEDEYFFTLEDTVSLLTQMRDEYEAELKQVIEIGQLY